MSTSVKPTSIGFDKPELDLLRAEVMWKGGRVGIMNTSHAIRTW